MPDHLKPFQIESNALKVATGAVLTQLDSNGDRHPCAFLSKTLSLTEQNYEIYDRELLGIVRALDEWRHYIQGSPHRTIVYSDHKNLTTAQKLNQQQARWSLYLSEFDLHLIHIPGMKMILSDVMNSLLSSLFLSFSFFPSIPFHCTGPLRVHYLHSTSFPLSSDHYMYHIP